MIPYKPNLKHPARALRKTMPPAERLLWTRLRNNQLHNTRFYRQKPLGPYIVDFYSHTANLVIELDGSQHYETPEAQATDQQRDAYLQSLGLHVLRFTNHQLFTNLDGILQTINQTLLTRTQENPP